MQQGLLEFIQCVELALVEGFESLDFFLHRFSGRYSFGLGLN